MRPSRRAKPSDSVLSRARVAGKLQSFQTAPGADSLKIARCVHKIFHGQSFTQSLRFMLNLVSSVQVRINLDIILLHRIFHPAFRALLQTLPTPRYSFITRLHILVDPCRFPSWLILVMIYALPKALPKLEFPKCIGSFHFAGSSCPGLTRRGFPLAAHRPVCPACVAHGPWPSGQLFAWFPPYFKIFRDREK